VRWYLKAEERLPQPPPPDVDDRLPVLAGTVIWAVLALVGVLFRDRLAEDGREWWIWAASAGFLLGLVGLAYMHRRAVRGERPVTTG
jgi:hypothetical protein